MEVFWIIIFGFVDTIRQLHRSTCRLWTFVMCLAQQNFCFHYSTIMSFMPLSNNIVLDVLMLQYSQYGFFHMSSLVAVMYMQCFFFFKFLIWCHLILSLKMQFSFRINQRLNIDIPVKYLNKNKQIQLIKTVFIL